MVGLFETRYLLLIVLMIIAACLLIGGYYYYNRYPLRIKKSPPNFNERLITNTDDETDGIEEQKIQESELERLIPPTKLREETPRHHSSNFEVLEELLDENLEEGWEAVKSVSGINVYRKVTEDSASAIIRADAVIPNASCYTVWKAIWDGETRPKWDNVLCDFEVTRKFSEYEDVIYFYVKSPVFFVQDREFLQKREYKIEHGTYIICYKSVQLDEIPPREGKVRAETILSGYRIYPDPADSSNTYLEFLSQNDVKGNIPKTMINSVAPKKASDWIKKLIGACEVLEREE